MYIDVMREVQDLLEAKGLYPGCVCITARRHDFGDDKALAYSVFKLGDFNAEYRILMEKFKELSWEVKDGLEEEKAVKHFHHLWEDYKKLLLSDPYLPSELLPDDWEGEEAREEFQKLTLSVSKKINLRKSQGNKK